MNVTGWERQMSLSLKDCYVVEMNAEGKSLHSPSVAGIRMVGYVAVEIAGSKGIVLAGKTDERRTYLADVMTNCSTRDFLHKTKRKASLFRRLYSLHHVKYNKLHANVIGPSWKRPITNCGARSRRRRGIILNYTFNVYSRI
jgi:hypothetical protein